MGKFAEWRNRVPTSKGLMISLALNLALFAALCATGLYAFMIKVDMEEQKGILIRNAVNQERLEAHLSQAAQDLAAARQEAENLRGRLNAQAMGDQMADSLKSPLPVEVSFRKSFWGRGLIAVIRNQSARSLTLVLAIRNPTLAKGRRFELKLGPQDKEEFGSSEGWEFASGDELAIYHNDYRGLKVKVP
jgi:Tfp pilus assembly protein PilN